MFYDRDFLFYIQSIKINKSILIKAYYYHMLKKMGFKKSIIDYILVNK